MKIVFTESRYRWKPAIQPFATSPPSGLLKSVSCLGSPGNLQVKSYRYQRISIACPRGCGCAVK